jgi:hypothetical protein
MLNVWQNLNSYQTQTDTALNMGLKYETCCLLA